MFRTFKKTRKLFSIRRGTTGSDQQSNMYGKCDIIYWSFSTQWVTTKAYTILHLLSLSTELHATCAFQKRKYMLTQVSHKGRKILNGKKVTAEKQNSEQSQLAVNKQQTVSKQTQETQLSYSLQSLKGHYRKFWGRQMWGL